MDLKELIDAKESYFEIIRIGRKNIAKLKKEKIEARAKAWSDAEGIADAKKDYVRSMVADFDFEISIEEANMEYAYNMIEVVNDKMMVIDDE